MFLLKKDENTKDVFEVENLTEVDNKTESNLTPLNKETKPVLLTIIQKGTVIEGNLVVEGNAELYGEVHGNIKCSHHINIFGSVKGNVVAESGEINEGFVSGDVSTKLHLVIGNKTEVLGNIDSKSAIINGKVKGDCTLTDVVSITGTGVVLGNISTKDLSVDQGAIIQGNIKINRDVFFESDDE